MKIKNALKKSKKRVMVIVVMLVILVVVLCWCFFNRQETDRDFGNRQVGRGAFMVSENMIAVSGVTSVGITEESFDVQNLSVGLEIEEVYISSGTEIAEGTKVLKLSEESIAEAREELKQVLLEADLAYRSGAIEYEQSKITALYNRDKKILSGEQAQEIYAETVTGLQDAVDKAQESVMEVKEQIAEYQSYVNDGSYSTYFEVDKYEEIYDTNLEAIEAWMEEWGLTWTEVVRGSSASSSSTSGISRVSSVSGGDVEETEVVSADDIQKLSALYKILEANRSDWDKVLEDYEEAIANAALQLQTLELQLPGLEQELAEAKENYETQVLQAKLTYETSLSNAESAENDYETAIEKAESDYESLKDAWEDARENLELFESSVGDGYFYASGNGAILRTMVRVGWELTSEAVVFMYSNPEEMTVTVSVDQADISKISLGDSAYIQSTEYGSFEGNVTEINPVSNSGSRTSVTYNVTVTFSGDTTALPANESVTVIFGMDEETRAQMMQQSGAYEKNGEKPTDEEKTQMPEGGEMPQLPEGVEKPASGEKPQGGRSNRDSIMNQNQRRDG